MLTGLPCLAASPRLPATAPVPTQSPENPPETGTTNPQSPPLPMPRPGLPASTDVKRPEDVAPRTVVPEAVAPPAAQPNAAAPPQSAAKPEPADVQEERLCRDDLRALGVDFVRHDALADPVAGCFVTNPVTLKSLGKTIKLAPEAILSCDMARATARFMQDVVSPAAKSGLGSELTSINNASAYVCRPRHGTMKVSEHGLGNAIDISSFGLADGRRIEVNAGAEEKAAAFLDGCARRLAGRSRRCSVPAATPTTRCISISTSNRRSGSAFCQ